MQERKEFQLRFYQSMYRVLIAPHRHLACVIIIESYNIGRVSYSIPHCCIILHAVFSCHNENIPREQTGQLRILYFLFFSPVTR